MNTGPEPLTSSWAGYLVLPETRSAVRAVRSLSRALAVGKRPPVVPLLLHGPPGTGKTHLTTALLRKLAEGEVVATARSVAAGDVARSASENDPGFADPELAACDLLVLEDVQLLPPRAADPACDLIDRRTSRRKAIVATANIGPAGLGHLPRKLTSRLAAGLVVQLEPLSAASRRVILAAAAKDRGVRLTDDALDWLAEQNTGGGVRVLLGLLQNLAQVASGFPGPLDRTIVEETLAGTGQPTSNGRDVGVIVKRVAAAFGVTERELLGPSRLRRVMVPRQVAMFLARELCRLSLPRLGVAFGRDHTTVLHAVRKVEADMDTDERLASVVRDLRAAIV